MKPRSKLFLRRTGILSAGILLGVAFFLSFSGFASAIDGSNTFSSANTSQTGRTNIVPVGAPAVAQDTQKAASADGWKLVWDEEFSDNSLDIKKWSAIEKRTNYNDELESYRPQNVAVKNGQLNISAINNPGTSPQFSSGMIDTKYKFGMQYGKLDVGLKQVKGAGLFPAVWLLPESEDYAELDAMEALGNDPSVVYGGHHYQSGAGKMEDMSSIHIQNPLDFHDYSMVWMPDELTWSVDGNEFFSCKSNIPQERMYIIMNLAVGGLWPGDPDETTVFPSSFAVDYLRVYSKN